MAFSDPLTRRLNDLTTYYRPQRQWVEGRGLLIVIAHFFTGIGAGAWVFSWIADYDAGFVAAYVLVAFLGGGSHLLFLGRWGRFWRMISRPQSSWVSRGLLGVAWFGLFGGLYTALFALPGSDRGVAGDILLGLSMAGVAVILTYQGLVLAVSRAIPFWRNPLLPPLYAAYALRGGAAVLLLLAAIVGEDFDVHEVELVKLWVVVSSAVLVVMYLAVANRAGATARRSVHELVAGSFSPVFYGGVVLLGLAIPIIAGSVGYATETSRVLLGVVASSSLIGDFYVKFCVARAGIYVPITAGFPLPPNLSPSGPAAQRPTTS
jgi:formate-dependent nitrite reductase membrane component NrfD